LVAWAVLSSWAVGGVARSTDSNLAGASVAMLAAAGFAIVLPHLWKRREVAVFVVAALVAPLMLNARTESSTALQELLIGLLAILLGLYAVANTIGTPLRRRRRK
jgi:hypothetical protein